LRNEEPNELLGGTDIVKYFKLRRLQLASHIFQMDTSRIPRKILDGKFHGR
jgi:hypothetical protein